MTFPDDAAIERHTRALLDHTLPKAAWTHVGHFAAALWLLRHAPDRTATDAMRAIISGYNEATDTPNTDSGGYHHTITRASLAAAQALLAAYPADAPLAAVLADLMASPLGRPDWPMAYWRRETLFSVAARRGWVAPDLAPAPFL